nr:ral guanine nucleotide dissociation stimulator isoform X3 [Oryctolagus cuniculus]
MFSCCVPTSRGRGPRNPRDEGLWQRFQRWFSPHPHHTQPCSTRQPQSSKHNRGQKLLNKVLYSISRMERQEANRGRCWPRVKKPSKLIEYDAHIGWRAQEDTLQKLVDRLVPAFLGFEPLYVPTFLRTYRAFATTGQVLNALLGRFPWFSPTAEGVLQDAVKHAISTILATWLEQYPQDFDHPPQYTSLHVLLDYAQLILRDSELGHRVQLLLGRLQHPEPTEAELEGPAEAPIPQQELVPPPSLLPDGAPQPEQARIPALETSRELTPDPTVALAPECQGAPAAPPVEPVNAAESDPDPTAVSDLLQPSRQEMPVAESQDLELFAAPQLAPVPGPALTAPSLTTQYVVMFIFLLYLRIRNYYSVYYKIRF